MIALTLILGMFTWQSCKNDFLDEDYFLNNHNFNKQSKPKFTIEELQDWYNMTQSQQSAPQRIEGAGGNTPKELFYSEPDWNIYCTNQIKGYTVIDVDLTQQMQNDLFVDEHKKAYQANPNWHYLHSYTRMVVLKSTEDNSKFGFLMTLIPSVEYIKNHKSKIAKTTYSKREKDYDGYILFHELDGTFSNGWIYKKGKITASISLPTNLNDTINNNNKKLFKIWRRNQTYRFVSQRSRMRRVKSNAPEADIKEGGELDEITCTGTRPQDDNNNSTGFTDWNWYFWDQNGSTGGEEDTTNDWLDRDDPTNPDRGGYNDGGGRRGGSTGNNNKSLEKRLKEMYTTAYEQIKTPEIKRKLAKLQSKEILRKHYETGYSVNRDGTVKELKVKGTNVEVEIKQTETIGYMHTHYDDYRDGMGNIVPNIKMFSPADVLKFLQLVGNAKAVEGANLFAPKDVFGMMVSSEGTYMLKYYGTEDPNNVKWLRENTKKADDFEKSYKKYFKENRNKEKAFLLFLKNEINFPGIQLMKIKKDNKIQSIDLSSENEIMRTDY